MADFRQGSSVRLICSVNGSTGIVCNEWSQRLVSSDPIWVNRVTVRLTSRLLKLLLLQRIVSSFNFSFQRDLRNRPVTFEATLNMDLIRSEPEASQLRYCIRRRRRPSSPARWHDPELLRKPCSADERQRRAGAGQMCSETFCCQN